MKDRILESFIQDFASRHGYQQIDLSEQFMHFVSHCVVSRETSDAFDPLDLCVDGEGDLGIDAVAVLIEGHVVGSTTDVDFFCEKLGRLSVQFVLVQSTSGTSFNGADIGSFLSGVRSFFSPELPETANDALREAFQLKDYIYQHSIEMEHPPHCSLFYASSGEWHDDKHLLDRIDSDLEPLRASSLFSETKFLPLDASRLKAIYRSLRHKTVSEISFEKTTILPPIRGVTEAYLGILPATEYLKLITDESGEIQTGLFYDNVRAFQGLNPVNQEIAQTLKQAKENSLFALLNNGVTVVAKSVKRVGEKFKVVDYQIVNGCQTSHVLFLCRGDLTSEVFVPVKLVVTDDPDITNRVIRATNRQTEVKVEAFESLAPFHRVLEEFYASFTEAHKRMYYERRSNQYAYMPIEPQKIVSLAMQCKAFLAMFLDSPHSTPRYYGEILETNRERMFLPEHRPFPYYASAYALSKIATMLKSRLLSRRYSRFRHHIIMLLRVLSAGQKMPPLKSKRMDAYCEGLCEVLWNESAFRTTADEACARIDRALRSFRGDRKLAHRLRDFTAHLLPYTQKRPRGKINYWNVERGFGFAEIAGDEDVFVHISKVSGRSGGYLEPGELIEFDVIRTDRGLQARDVEVVG